MTNDQSPHFSDDEIQNAGHPTPPAPAPLPPIQHDYLHPVTDQPKHTYNPKRFRLIVVLVVVFSLLAVAAMVVFAILPMQQRQAVESTPAQTSVKVAPLTAKQTIESVNVYFKGAEAAKNSISRPVKAPNKDFYTVIPDVAPLVSLAGPVAADQSASQLRAILSAFKYDKFNEQVLSDGANGTNYLSDQTRSDVICQVEVTKQADAKADHYFQVRCLDMSVYTEYSDAQNPLVVLYTPLTASSVQYGFVGKPVTRPSRSAGYTLGELPVGSVIDNQITMNGRRALYYQSPDKLWHYLVDNDNNVVIDCTQFQTNILRTAYAGEPCRQQKTGAIETIVAPKKAR